MNALTVREPWASLIANGVKQIETRHWYPPRHIVGQRIAIHASKGLSEGEIGWFLETPAAYDALTEVMWCGGGSVATAFPATRGRVLATATLTDVLIFTHINVSKIIAEFGASIDELQFGDFSAGRYGWMLTDVQPLPEPIPARGQQGLWEWQEPDELRGAA